MVKFVNVVNSEKELKVISYSEANNCPTIELMEKYYLGFEEMKETFSSKTLKDALEVLRFKDIATLSNVKEENIKPYISHGYFVLNNKPYKEQFEEWKGEWHREYYANAYKVWVPSPYQHNYEKYVKKCLELTFPWMTNFKWHIYSITKTNDLIYLEVDPENKNKAHHSVYVPVSALFEKNINKIIKTHTNYFKEYYNMDGTRKEYLDEALNLLNTKEFKRLCEYITKEE